MGVGNILIKVGAETAGAVSGLSNVNKALGDTTSAHEKMGAGLRKAALPAAAALGAIGVAAIGATKAAMEDAAAQDHLAGVLERTAGATKAQIAETEKWIDSQAKATGVADDELRPALEAIATATGDVASAQGYLSQALDISAASGKSVEDVSKAIAKGYQGSTGALAKLVPGLSEGARKSKDFAVIMDELAQKTGGAMADQAGTAAGQMQRFQLAVSELQESLGAALLPIVEALLPVLLRLSTLVSDNIGVVKALIAIVASLSAAILIINGVMKAYAAAQVVWGAATKAATVAQWLWNAALEANPIGLVIIALVALGAAFVVLYKKSETFRDIVQAALGVVKGAVGFLGTAFQALQTAASAAWGWIQDHWKLALFAFGPLGAAIALIADNWDRVRAVAGAAADAVAGAIRGITSAINEVIGAVQSLIGWLGKIHVPHIDLPGPLSLPGTTGFPSTFGAVPASSSARAGAPVTVNVYGAVDPEGTARAIRRILSDSERRRGR